MSILVTGGAGYIGSHVVRKLKDMRFKVVVVDSEKTVIPQYVDGVDYFRVSYGDTEAMERILKLFRVHMVVHLGGLIDVSESETNQYLYNEVNVRASERLLHVMNKLGIKNILFSSTCAVYGNPLYTPIDEGHEVKPISFYGRTKLNVENLLDNFEMNYIILRFFNVAGSDGVVGEWHKKETHVIPNLIKAMMNKEDFIIFGDGEQKRDFVHVSDLAEAHVRSIFRLLNSKVSETINIGSGRAYSVNDLVDIVNTMYNVKLNVRYEWERAGDPLALLSDISKAEKVLDFSPKFGIKNMIASHVEWVKGGRHEYH